MKAPLSLLVLAGLLTSWSCTSRVHPPKGVVDPITVYVVENGMHGGVLLPRGRSLVQYDYGEWEYYAKNNTWWFRVIPAMAWSTDGTIGRRELALRRDRSLAYLRYVFAADKIWSFQVERDAADRVQRQLDRRFNGLENHFYDAELDTWFGRDEEQRYSMVNTCNHEVDRWLEALGCSIEGPYWAWDYDVIGASMADRRATLPATAAALLLIGDS